MKNLNLRIKKISTVFWLIFVLCNWATPAVSQDVNQIWLRLMNQGTDAYARNDFGTALESFKQASQTVPTDTLAFIYILDCCDKTGNVNDAEHAFQSLKYLKNVKPLYYRQIVSLFRNYARKYSRALSYVNEGLRAFPGNRELLFEELSIYYEYGDYETALDKLDSYLNSWDDDYNAVALRIKITLEKYQDYNKALEYIKNAQKQFANNVSLQKSEYTVYLRTGKLQMAESLIEKLIELSPNDPELYYNLALIYYERQDYEASAEICLKAIELKPDYLEAIYNVGTFYYFLGMRYNRALSEMTLNQYKNQGREFEQIALKNFLTAKPYFEQATQLNPDDLDAFENLNTISALIKNIEQNIAQTSAWSSEQQIATPSDSLIVALDSSLVDNSDGIIDVFADGGDNQSDSNTAPLDRDNAIIVDNKINTDSQQEDNLSEAVNTESENITDAENKKGEEKVITAPERIDFVIENFRFTYANNAATLQNRQTGFIEFDLINTGASKAQAPEVVLMQPSITPGLIYKPTFEISEVDPQSITTVSVPVTYNITDNQAQAIEKMQGTVDKMRCFVRSKNGIKSDLIEFEIAVGDIEMAMTMENTEEDITYNQIPRNFLVIVAMDEYQNWSQLSGVARNAQSLKSVLLSKYEFAEEHVFELYNAEATHDNIRNLLIRLKGVASDIDNIVFYYAGHSVYDENFDEGAWIPYDAHTENYGDYIPNSRIISYLQSIPARHNFIISDASFSKSLFMPHDNFQQNNDQIPSSWALASGILHTDTNNPTENAFSSSLIAYLDNYADIQLPVSVLISDVRQQVSLPDGTTPQGKALNVPTNAGGELVLYRK